MVALALNFLLASWAVTAGALTRSGPLARLGRISSRASTRCHAESENRPVAIITGGARGIGRGISEALSEEGYDLLLTYNSNMDAAEAAKKEIVEAHGNRVELVGGDIALEDTRHKLFDAYDKHYPSDQYDLGAVVHNAGQYVGVTASNSANLPGKIYGFGDGSLLEERDGKPNLDQMHYYQQMYGDAYIDLCERGLARMVDGRGTLIGISSPGCNFNYRPNTGYALPGSGKCVMEYAMRLFAVRAATRGINCNVIVPGVTETDAWGAVANARGIKKEAMLEGLVGKIVPMERLMSPKDLGDTVAFLCSPKGKLITGVSLPVDGGLHLGSGVYV